MYKQTDIQKLSISIINYINNENIPCMILTKGILPSDLLKTSKLNWYGITVISLDEGYLKKVEPGAAPIFKRIEALEKLHKEGFKTWVSIEPYPTPNLVIQDINNILESIKFVDKIVFGKHNYNSEVSKYKGYKNFYNECAKKVEDFCSSNNIECIIKNKTITQ